MSAAFTTAQPTVSANASVQDPPPAYAFLAYPPPQKKRPTQPLPSPPAPKRAPCSQPYPRRRSATTSAISAWVAAVHPGSPAPISPRRRSSISSPRRSSYGSASIVSRRPSVTGHTPRSGSFLGSHDHSRQVITPSVKDFKPTDLAACGYTSVFVNFPDTPLSATIPALPKTATRPPPNFQRAPSSPVKPAKGLKHFRSLTALKTSTRARSKSGMRLPTSPAHKSPTFAYANAHAHAQRKAERAQASAAVSASKKSKYAKFRPPPLAAELALAQLADGGSLEDHIRAFAEAQAKADGAVERTADGRLVGVADVWRDGVGGVWRDQDEEWEYAHLLGGDEEWCGSETSWVRFGSPTKPSTAPRKQSAASVDTTGSGSGAGASVGADGEIRRESVSSQDSDLDARFAMRADDERDDLAAFGSALAPACARRPGMSVLAIPARTRRAAKHLRKPEFLLDVFPVPEGGAAPSAVTSAPVRVAAKPRRRPAPLTLTPPSPAYKCPTNPLDAEQVRGDFIAASFAPAPAPASAPAPVPSTARRAHAAAVSPRAAASSGLLALKKAPSKMGMRGLFRAMGSKKGDL